VDPKSVERRLAAILSADVVGYSRLMAENEAATVRTLQDYREEIGLLVAQHRGRVVDTAGDSLLAEFPTATEAVGCAVEIQGVLRVRNASLPADRKMEFRIGIHLGEVRVEGERLYGDGVNIAARLEALAEACGVCISATVHEQVRNKLDVGFTDLGDQTVKNIPDQVRVYRVQPRSQPEAPARASTPPDKRPRRLRAALVATAAVLLLLGLGLWASWPRPLGLLIDLAGVSGPPVNPTLPDKPSIVVLPFVNMSGDLEQEYFSDGVTEELINDLAGVPELFVISRNSAFTYKGQPVKVRDVGRDLGVRYVLEGTVRKVGGRVRITAQLIDATSGFHLWSESYDRELSDILALQSEISQQILVALKLELHDAVIDRAVRRSSRDLKAQDTLWRGWAHLQRFTREDNLEARYLFERAIEQDPDFAVAYAFAGYTYLLEYNLGWNLDPTLLDRAAELAKRALALDPATAPAQTLSSSIYLRQGRLADALVAAERAVELTPNVEYPHLALGFALARQGRFVAALQSVAHAMRLNPTAPSGISGFVAYANFAAGRTEKAVELWEQVRAANPEMILARIPLAALYESEGRHEEARALGQEILRVNPDLTAESATELALAWGFDRDDVIDNLRSAGLPEVAQPADGPFTVPGFSGAPAIAVLAFDNLSGDPEQEYFADGIAEDLITRLSSWGSFPVIARNSSFTYKGKAVDVTQVSRELGVRYVVEGSVRRAGDRVRIAAQLIDATTGHHVWAETYDRELRDIFALQDEISEAIAASVQPEIRRAEVKRVVRRRPESLDAYESQLRGLWHLWKFTPEHNAAARRFFERAVELDPHYVDPWFGVALTHFADVVFEWSDARSESVAALERSARECVELDAESARCQLSRGFAHWVAGKQAENIAAFERAVRLDPSLGAAYGWLGFALSISGRPEEAIANLEKARRLDPHDPATESYLIYTAWAHFAAGRYAEALAEARRAVEMEPRDAMAHRTLAASYAQLGRLEEARSALEEALRLEPDLSLRKVRRQNLASESDFLARWLDGLRKAGLKE